MRNTSRLFGKMGQTWIDKLVILLCMIFLFGFVLSANDPNKKDSAGDGSESMQGQVSHIEMYKRLFEKHRVMQLDAVKSIQNFGEYAQRYQLVKMMLQQLFPVIEEAKKNLTEWGFLPGDPFPLNSTIRDSMSKVLENTAMFGDLVLRLPDIVHDLYDKNKDWQLSLAWGLWFCSESKVFEGSNAKLLNLMAQEVNLKPKDDNYVNPFKSEFQGKENLKLMKNGLKSKSKPKKKKDKLKRGPRLSGGRTEL